jgi:hypothetical protein
MQPGCPAAHLAVVAGYLDTEIAAILADTNELQTDWANGGRLDLLLDTTISQTTAAAILAAVGLASANLDTQLAALASYVDTEVAAIKAKTDNLPAAPAATGDIPSAAANAAAVLAVAVEGVETLVETIRLMRAALVGKSDGFPTGPAHFRDKADAKNRITATVDADGNRTVVTTDAT